MRFSKILIFVLVIAFIIRLIGLDQSLWLDEAITVMSVQNNSLLQLIVDFLPGDVHPPLHYIILWFWVRIFGSGEISVRLPSVILSCLSITVTYFIGKKLFNQNIGLVASMLMSVSPLLYYYSQEARMYSLNVLLVCSSMYFFIRLLTERQRSRINEIGFVFSSIGVFYSDYIIYTIFPVQISYLAFLRRDLIRKYLVLISIAFVFLIPWLPIFYKQFLIGQATAEILPEWSKVVGSVDAKGLGLLIAKTIIGKISFDNKFSYALIVIAGSIIYGGLIVLNFKKINEGMKLLLIWVLLPIVLISLASLYIKVFSYHRMVFILPAFYLLVSRGINVVPINLRIITFVFVLTASTYFIYYFHANPRFQREDWRSAVHYLEKSVDRDSIILFENNTVPLAYQYYSTSLDKSLPGLRAVPAKSIHDIVDLPKVRRIYIMEYLVDITDNNRLLEKKVLSNGFTKTKTVNFNGVGFINAYEK